MGWKLEHVAKNRRYSPASHAQACPAFSPRIQYTTRRTASAHQLNSGHPPRLPFRGYLEGPFGHESGKTGVCASRKHRKDAEQRFARGIRMGLEQVLGDHTGNRKILRPNPQLHKPRGSVRKRKFNSSIGIQALSHIRQELGQAVVQAQPRPGHSEHYQAVVAVGSDDPRGAPGNLDLLRLGPK